MKPEAAKAKSWRKRAIVAGILLAVACKSLPHEYHVACETLAQICTGGLLP